MWFSPAATVDSAFAQVVYIRIGSPAAAGKHSPIPPMRTHKSGRNMRSASCARWILAVFIPATSMALGQPSGFTTQQIGLREGLSSLLITGMAHLPIFKEAVHNIVKHSAATTASISAQTQTRSPSYGSRITARASSEVAGPTAMGCATWSAGPVHMAGPLAWKAHRAAVPAFPWKYRWAERHTGQGIAPGQQPHEHVTTAPLRTQ